MTASLQAKLAAERAAAARTAWRQHQAHCPGCKKGSTGRGSSTLCREGKPLRAAAVLTAAELEREKKADKAPNPNQKTLF